MCGPVVLWDWYVIDAAFLLVLVGGSIVLRTKVASPFTWLGFGTLSTLVGAFLITATYVAHLDALAAAATLTPMAAMTTVAGC